MVRFYCPICWNDFEQDLAHCPLCGADIAEFWNTKDYMEKLIVALEHPEPTTPIRAAWLLGQKQDPRAIEPLKQLLKTTHDPYIARAAVQALSKMDRNDIFDFLQEFANHPVVIVRQEAQSALSCMSQRQPPQNHARQKGDANG
jgi:hypothetical protein